MENRSELDDMKMQIAEFKSKLDNQQIINDQLMRKAIREKARWLKRNYYIMLLVALISVPYCFWAFGYVGMSMPFTCVTSLFLLIAAIYTYYSSNAAVNSDFINCNLLDARKKMVRMRKLNDRWLLFGIPFLFLWLGWFFYETSSLAQARSLCIGGIVGLVIGLTFGLINLIKTRRSINEIVKEIEDVCAEEEN